VLAKHDAAFGDILAVVCQYVALLDFQHLLSNLRGSVRAGGGGGAVLEAGGQQ